MGLHARLLYNRASFFFPPSFLCLYNLVLDIFFTFVNLTQIIIVITYVCTVISAMDISYILPVFELKRKRRHSSTTAAADNIIIYCLIDIFFSVQILCKRIRGKTLHNHTKTFTYIEFKLLDVHIVAISYACTVAEFKIYSFPTAKNLRT